MRRVQIEMEANAVNPRGAARGYFYGLAIAAVFLLVALGFGAALRLVAFDTSERLAHRHAETALASLSRTAAILDEVQHDGRDAQRAGAAQALKIQLGTLAEMFTNNEIQTYDLDRLRRTATVVALLNPSGMPPGVTAGRGVTDDDAGHIIAHMKSQEAAMLRLHAQDISIGQRQTITVLIGIGLLAAALTALAVRLTLSESRARRQVEGSLRESEARYRLITEYASDVIFQLGLDLTREYVSPASAKIMGYPPEEMIGRKAASEFHPDDVPAVATAYQALLAGGDGETLIARTRHRDGRWVWVEARVRLVRDHTGAPVKIIGVMSDVTARRTAEAALQESEAKFRALYNHAPAMMYSLDPDSRVMTISDEMLRVFGYRREEVIGRDSLDFMTPASRRDIALIARPDFAANGSVSDIPAQFLTKNGEIRDVLLSAVAERDDDGTIIRAIVATVDITKYLVAEAALRASEAQYRIVADNAGDLIMRFNAHGRRTYVSPSSTRIVGFTPEELIAMPVGSLAIPEESERLAAAYHMMMATGEGTRQLMQARHKDGRVLWLEANCTVVRDPGSGAPAGIMSFARDVTERQVAIELAEQARREAELANGAKSEFLATMSHEIRTPMNGVLGFASILLDTPLSAEQKRLVSLVKVSGEALLAIINDILDLSKIEAGSLELEAITLSLRDIVDGSISVVRASSIEKSLQLEVEVAADVPDAVIGDPNRLRQVLLNLLSNAIKFTESGSVTVRIGLLPGSGGQLLFEVVDTGIGIPEDRLHLLFQVFSQIDSSTTRKFGGTGLGLAISRRLIEAMPGGQIGVDSTPGVGSRFWFTVDLPRAEKPMMVTRRQASENPARPARILVAEDMLINQMVVEGILTHAGHHVALVSDGAAAVAAVAKGGFDLVLMDMHMPVMDGLDATRAIRALPGLVRNIPIIALSANAMPPEIELCQAAGMNGHLAKPIQQDTLLETVALWSDLADRHTPRDRALT